LKFNLFILFSFFFGFSQLNGQLVEEYKERLAEKHYKDFSDREMQINEISDSLAIGRIYYDLGKDCLRYQEELALRYELKAQRIFKKFGHDSLYHMVSCSMSFPYINNGQYDKAEPLLKAGLEYWIKTDSKNWIGHTYSKISYLESERGNLVSAVENILKCYQTHKSIRPLSKMGGVINNMIILYSQIGDCESVVKYTNAFLEADSLAISNYNRLIKRNSVSCFERLNQDSIASLFRKESALIYKNSSSFKLKARTYVELSELAMAENQWDSAEIYLDTANIYARIFGNSKGIADVFKHYSEMFLAQNRIAEAKHAIDSLIFHGELANDLSALEDGYKLMSEYYYNTEEYQKSIFYRNKTDSVKQISLSEDVVVELKKLDIRIQQKANTEKIQLLEQQNLLKEKNLKSEEKIKFILSIVLILVLLFSFLLYRLFKDRSYANKELNARNETIGKALETNKVLMKEIHHRVKNNLQVVSSLLYLQSRFIKNDSAKGALRTGRSRVQAMSILHQKLYQKENIKHVHIKEYFEDLTENLFNTYNLEDSQISFETNVEDLVLDIDIVVPLGLITNELISNALKHAFTEGQSGLVKIKVIKKDDMISLSVRDDGKGIAFDKIPENSKSLGMDLVKSFAEKLNASIGIENSNGTKIEICFIPDVV